MEEEKLVGIHEREESGQHDIPNSNMEKEQWGSRKGSMGQQKQRGMGRQRRKLSSPPTPAVWVGVADKASAMCRPGRIARPRYRRNTQSSQALKSL